MSSIASSRCRAGSPMPAPGFGWPLGERTWINPSPNAPNLWMARAYAGTVMLEGTTLSEGRGTTRPLELFGAPDIDARTSWRRCTRWRRIGCAVAACAIAGSSRRSTSTPANSATACRFTPKVRLRSPRVQAVAHPGARLQGDPPLLSGLSAVARFRLRIRTRQTRHRRHQRRSGLREWVDDSAATPQDLDALALPDEQAWTSERHAHLRY